MSKYDILPVGEDINTEPSPVEAFLPQPPFLLAIVAPPGSGKTNLLINLLLKPEFYNGYFHNVFIFSPSLGNPQWNVIKLKPENCYSDYTDKSFNEITDQIESDHKESKDLNMETPRSLIIFDDFAGDGSLYKENMRSAAMRYTMRNRHYGVSMIFVTQKYNLLPRKLRTSIPYFIVFNIPQTEREQMYNEIGPDMTLERFLSIFNKATKEKYNFIYINRYLNPIQYYHNFKTCITPDKHGPN